MTDQPTFADLEYQGKKRQTRREEFLGRMDSLIPWEKPEGRIRPHYFPSERGRRPYSLSVMLRARIIQLCYNLSGPAIEDLLYEAESARRFVGLRLTDALPETRVILFGSRARGDNRPHSDVDIVVVVPDNANPRDKDAQARRAVDTFRKQNGVRLDCDILVMTETQFQRNRLAKQHIAGQPIPREFT